MPVYNREKIIDETLQSIFIQTYKDWECLIVDDFSTDNTAYKIKEWELRDQRFKYLKNKRKKGAQGARNTGLQFAEGQFILFVDSDDILHFQKIEKQLAIFKSCPEIDAVYSLDRFFFRVPEDNKVLWNVNTDKCFISRFLLDDPPFSIQGPIWRSTIIKKLGLFWDENLFCWQDWDFHLKAIIRGAKIVGIDDVLGYIRTHSENRISNLNELKKANSILNAIKSITIELNENKLYTPPIANLCNVFIINIIPFVLNSNNKNKVEKIYLYFKVVLFLFKINKRFDLYFLLKAFWFLSYNIDNDSLKRWTLQYLTNKFSIIKSFDSSWSKFSQPLNINNKLNIH